MGPQTPRSPQNKTPVVTLNTRYPVQCRRTPTLIPWEPQIRTT